MDPLEGLVGLTLDTLGGGAADELFQHELSKVIANIADANTDPKAKRQITVQVTFAPMGDPDRSVVGTAVTVTSKLAGLKPISSTTYLIEKDGVPTAVAKDIRQRDMFEAPGSDDSIRVLPIHQATGN